MNERDFINITVVGLGFVGLTAALGFAEKGYSVKAYDSDIYKTIELSKGELPFHEPGLSTMLNKHLNENLVLCDSLEESLSDAKMIFICVGTPYLEGTGLDLSMLLNVVKDVCRFSSKDPYPSIIVKSTIPPGTMRTKIKPVIEDCGLRVGQDIGLAYNPEFLREGNAWDDFMHPDRIIIGELDGITSDLLVKLYESFSVPYAQVSAETAEMLKFSSNALLATMISFANEQALIAEHIGQVNIPELFHLLHMDKRWSGSPAGMVNYVYPGCGFGGYCLPKDTLALKNTASQYGVDAKILNAVMEVNLDISEHTVRKVIGRLKHRDEQIGILGLAFKPGSDDVRYSPAVGIIEALLDEGCTNLSAYDPMAMRNFEEHYSLPLKMANSLDEIVAGSDICVIVTAWPEFQTLTDHANDIRIIDARYMLTNKEPALYSV
ncbi:UDP-glucose/GDP-mannose dehydrogenase family protein [Paenibacillus xylanexedens]|uniref:UDP-glucose dehydrogenase family protein n=1 Tax=Paenibacillus xylanexedens TaxID=528191 RepID=UPI0011A61E9B|nr:nucleotide sugar dehydrogenase [Paenibacillus xylanexedens]